MLLNLTKNDSLTNIFWYFWGCGKGYFGAKTGPATFNRTCMICPSGSYSDTDTATDCTECPEGQTTIQERSSNSSDCQGDANIFHLVHFCTIKILSTYFYLFSYTLGCGKGYFAARTGPLTRSCMICPQGSFSDTNSATGCFLCPSGQTRTQAGSTSSSDCRGSFQFISEISRSITKYLF